ncbi:allene oxide synthase 2-like isoform X2 [Chenopodium quinoa]|uniref:Allene oxide synthase n=1 Tax=Chenopodium quinoa TaxID=63459 RepID=A0A803LNZ0_CHEQI|nr:allene oxide synthase 2-like isoform X2 [Chenopodium quinoa]
MSSPCVSSSHLKNKSDYKLSSPPLLSDLPLREIPGSYGLPFFGAIKDRWDYFYVQGEDQFFRSRMEKYNSTVFRVNMPPGPWISHDSRVIVLLDGNSFPVLFDTFKVEKRDVLTGTYMPSTSFTGGYRVCAYLDPSEPAHASLKSLLLSFLTSKHEEIVPLYKSCLKGMFDELEDQLRGKGRAEFGPPNDVVSLEFVFRLFCDGKSPLDTKLESKGPSMFKKWLICQLAPLKTLGLSKLLIPIDDFILHSIRLPFFLVKGDYKRLYDAFYSSATSYLDKAESFGISREEACHNLVFIAGFNAFGGFLRWFPLFIKWVASGGETLHRELAKEIRAAVRCEGGVTLNAINKMTLTKSVVYEALRIEPPVLYQYGLAKDDLMIHSHDAAFKIKKGEMIFGYQPFATKDPKIFHNPDKFIGNRFVGEKGEKLLKYVLWSNGRGIDDPTMDNKQCPGKNLVELLSRFFLVEFFLRYDTFSVEIGTLLSDTTVTFLSLKKATTSA